MPDYAYRMTDAKCPECKAPVRAKILLSLSSNMSRPQERPRGFDCSVCRWATPEPSYFD